LFILLHKEGSLPFVPYFCLNLLIIDPIFAIFAIFSFSSVPRTGIMFRTDEGISPYKSKSRIICTTTPM